MSWAKDLFGISSDEEQGVQICIASHAHAFSYLEFKQQCISL
jgi:hypothetical protein